MKNKVAILVFFSILLFSCAPATPTQEEDVIVEVATETPTDKAQIVQEPTATEEPLATEIPTETPTETPLACITLLSPVNGAEIPTVGKVTFSWTPMDEVEKYVLNITLPSGEIVSFETDQTFRDRYMEAFVAGGEYQWQVIAQDTNGNEICISKVVTFVALGFVRFVGKSRPSSRLPVPRMRYIPLRYASGTMPRAVGLPYSIL